MMKEVDNSLKQLVKKIQILLVGLLMTGQLITPLTTNAATKDDDFVIAAKAAIAVDAETGKIFYEKNADKPLPIASMTKLITLYLILEAIKQEKLAWDDQVEISDHLLKISQDLNLSNIPLTQDKTYSVRDLFNASAIVSANAAVTALAEKVTGSEKEFVDLMRHKLESWGITDAYIISTSGINNEDAKGRTYPGSKENEENLVSAKDMAIIARHLVNDYPEVLNVTKEATIIFDEDSKDPIPMDSTNWMLPKGANFKEGVDGLKTGTTDLAGECFAGTIEKDGTRIVTIIMNADNTEEDSGARFVETSRLIDFVYNNWNYSTLYKKGDVIGTQKVKGGVDITTPVILNQDVTGWVKKDHTYPVTIQKEDLKAGLKKGQAAGTVTINQNDNELGFIDRSASEKTYPLVTSNTLEKAKWYDLVSREATNLLKKLFK